MQLLKTTCGVLAATLLLAGCGESTSPGGDGARVLKLAYVMKPRGAAHEAAQLFAKLVEEKTDGSLTVKLFPSGQLGTDRSLAEDLIAGDIDLVVGGTAPIGWYIGQYACIEAPFIFRDYEHMDQVLHGPIGEEITDAFVEAKGVRILGWWHRGPRYLTTTERKITSLDDLEGLKLRVPELPTYIETWRILGANPTPITYSEMYMALKQGVVEGQENPLEAIYTESLYDVQKYIHNTRHLLGVYIMMTNDRMFQSLTEEQRTALREATAEAGQREHELMVKYDDEFVTKLKAEGCQFVDVDTDPWRKRVHAELPKRFEDVWAPGIFERIVNTR
jgi:tripartite ATP-independent transporter DctP family solute receptor